MRPQADRDAYLQQACAGDTLLLAAARSVLVAMEATDVVLDSELSVPADAAMIPGDQIGPYRLIEKLGEGGMGTVYLAERETPEFTQRVAIKLIRGHVLGKELQRRFETERRILASLNHPYIARLIDAGTTEAGSPYLVMEYVEGKPLDEYCDEQRLGVAQRLQLVRKVAMAVEAAHRNLIVHRDLKPSNVLVTADGIPKLLDFGIAKLLEPGTLGQPTEVTAFAERALTPDFASPEQILEGRATTASDVYSLAVLTYQLVAGERPYHIANSSPAELVRSVERLTVPRPSVKLQEANDQRRSSIAGTRATTLPRLLRQLTGDLDTILLRALHRDPERRYPSAIAFSDDLERFMDGRPVQARGDSLSYVTGRFVRRHRLAVGAAAALLVVLVGTLGLTTWAYVRAESARAAASQRYDQIRAIARTLMFDVYEDIEKVPGTVSARRTVAQTAQTYLESLASTPGASIEVRMEAAEGYSRLATILQRQSVADPDDRDAALGAYERALALFDSLADEYPEPARLYGALGHLHNNRSRMMLYASNDVDRARDIADKALAAYDHAVTLQPDDLGLVASRLQTHKHFADIDKWSRDYAAAATRLTDLIDEASAVAVAAPEQLDLLKVRADAHHLRGEVRWFEDDLEGGRDDYGKALELYQQTLRIGGPDPAIDGAMVITFWSRGNVLVDLGQPETALGSYDEAISRLDHELARDPDDVSTRRRWVVVTGSRAAALGSLGRHDEAIAQMLEVNTQFEELAALDDSPGNHRSIAVSYQVTSDMYNGAGRSAKYCDWQRATLKKWQEIDERWGLSEFDAEQPDLLRERLADC